MKGELFYDFSLAVVLLLAGVITDVFRLSHSFFLGFPVLDHLRVDLHEYCQRFEIVLQDFLFGHYGREVHRTRESVLGQLLGHEGTVLSSLDEDLDDVDSDNGVNEEYDSVVFLGIRILIDFVQNLQYIFVTYVHRWTFLDCCQIESPILETCNCRLDGNLQKGLEYPLRPLQIALLQAYQDQVVYELEYRFVLYELEYEGYQLVVKYSEN